MELKWFGAILVIAGCGGAGFLMAWSYKREMTVLRQLINGLEFMSSELQYRLTPLPELCRKTATQMNGCLKAAFLSLAQELERQIAPDATFCMKAALENAQDLPGSAQRLLQELGNTLGAFDLDGQLRGLSSLCEAGKLELQALERNCVQRTRSYQTLGLCAGAALAILFI